MGRQPPRDPTDPLAEAPHQSSGGRGDLLAACARSVPRSPLIRLIAVTGTCWALQPQPRSRQHVPHAVPLPLFTIIIIMICFQGTQSNSSGAARLGLPWHLSELASPIPPGSPRPPESAGKPGSTHDALRARAISREPPGVARAQEGDEPLGAADTGRAARSREQLRGRERAQVLGPVAWQWQVPGGWEGVTRRDRYPQGRGSRVGLCACVFRVNDAASPKASHLGRTRLPASPGAGWGRPAGPFAAGRLRLPKHPGRRKPLSGVFWQSPGSEGVNPPSLCPASPNEIPAYLLL